MKQHLKLVSTANMSNEDWLRYRKRGIGASEVGTIMGLNPYKASIQLFYEKLGEELDYNLENMAMFMGKEMEPMLAKLWQHWDGTVEGMIKNYRAGIIVRKCQRVNAYVHNPAYPWLFVSLDRKANRTSDSDEGAVELKTVEAWEAEKWENEIPPSHVVQVQTQLLVCEFTWGELATMKNGRHFDVLPFEAHQGIQESIVQVTGAFWQKVEEGRKIMTQMFEAQRNFNQSEVDNLNAELVKLEPEPDGSVAYNAYLKEKYKIALPGERIGTAEQLQLAIRQRNIKQEIKEKEEEARLYSQQLQNIFRDDFDVLDFGPNGYVSWKANKNGVRSLLNKTK